MKRIWIPLLALLASPIAIGDALSSNCHTEDAGIVLPPGFCATIFADGLGTARHLAVRDNGDVLVMSPDTDGGTWMGKPRVSGRGVVVALRDEDEDGRADRAQRFGQGRGTGIALSENHLYLGLNDAVVRYRIDPDAFVPTGSPEVIVRSFPYQLQHAAKSLALDGDGGLYVNVGAPSNACQRIPRTPGIEGKDPCPQRELQAGIWRFAADRTNQRHGTDGHRLAAGVRNAIALSWRAQDGQLYAVQHGRDQLHQLWPEWYDAAQGAELPAEEFLRLDTGSDFGWPYCYYDHQRAQRMLAPEYGGDGRLHERCDNYPPPIAAFPGHWAPNALVFYDRQAFPETYRDGAFIAFHGSWNRSPQPQQGYRVTFLPFDESGPSGPPITFAHGFAGSEAISSPRQARFRPTGLAVAPDGALFIADSQQGRIWRVHYQPTAEKTAARSISGYPKTSPVP
ncbi:MAG: PQQ-dependent sugar dehydrogenase [Pseudomonadota bacterium]|nr:PQQ-dependent sugar dehydrogenase [Pseudomonadota bacterium]